MRSLVLALGQRWHVNARLRPGRIPEQGLDPGVTGKQAAQDVDAWSTAAFDATDPAALAGFFEDLPGPIDHARPSSRSLGPGTVQAPRVFLPGPLNDRLWHLGFNRIDKLNEQLVAGREDAFYRWEFAAAAKGLPDDVIDHYVRVPSNPDSLRGNFGRYRALDTTIAQDEQRKTRRLPVLAIGGEASFDEHVGNAVQAVADDVHSVVIPGTGHFLAEEAPTNAGRVDRVPGLVARGIGRGTGPHRAHAATAR